MKKYCTRCGKPFDAIGREVICPSCKEHAAEEAKRAAVLKAKRASWTGESVPVRIGGRASTVIRAYGKANNMPFAAALDALLKASDFFQSSGKAWQDITPYKSHRRDKHATADNEQDVPQDVQDVPQDVQDAPQDVQDVPVKPVKTAASTAKASKASKASASKASPAKASKASTAKASKASASKVVIPFGDFPVVVR